MAIAHDYKYIRVHGTREALLVVFFNAQIFKADVILGIGRELLFAADLAARIDMPLVLSFGGVDAVSSALIGKLVLLNRKAKTVGIDLQFVDMSPAVNEIFSQARLCFKTHRRTV